MKILLVGGGGREHALADALSRENTVVDLLAAPGNPGIAELGAHSAGQRVRYAGVGGTGRA